MHLSDSSRVVFHSVHDMAGCYNLRKGEHVLTSPVKPVYTDINEVLELYHIGLYFDAGLFLPTWSPEDVEAYTKSASLYKGVIGRFVSNLDDSNVEGYFNDVIFTYVSSFWQLFNDWHLTKKVSAGVIESILSKEPALIHTLLVHPNIVAKYNLVLKDFLIANPKSAEILLKAYEVNDQFNKAKVLLPKSLTVLDKEAIISDYLDSDSVNIGYVKAIRNMRNRAEFKISDRTRLKAKRRYSNEIERFQESSASHSHTYGVSVSFEDSVTHIKNASLNNNVVDYSYSLDHITDNPHPYELFSNFRDLFEYVDPQCRINLVANEKNLGIFEMVMGVSTQDEYRGGLAFSISEMTSQAQIVVYSGLVNKLGTSLEDIVHHVFEETFREKYNFADNAKFSVPTATTSLEKIRLLAPEFESILKQFKIFVEEGHIDFDLLQISSSPSSIGNIPSLNQDKYLYLNKKNSMLMSCLNILFSDQRNLNYVKPHEDKGYNNFFDLLKKEKVKYSDYEDYQKPELNYLIDNGFISLNEDDFILVNNPVRLIILKDLYYKDVGSFYNYPIKFRQEVQQMAVENMIYHETTLFSKPEQAYFNYCLNKKDFTNGLDLRNSYLHGTQANHNEVDIHGNNYFTYLKLIFLVLLKIEDDLKLNMLLRDNTKN